MTHFKTLKGTELPFLNLKGKNYLQVAFRLIWFLEEKPNWRISTSIVERTDSFVIMEANILDEQGIIRSTAHKCSKFGPLELEKCETGAVGRALAYIGYGTQFAEDLFDEADDIADAPIAPKRPEAPQSAYVPANPHRKLTEPQVKRLWAIANKHGYANQDVFELLRRYKVNDPADLLKADYEAVCKYMEAIPKTEASQTGIDQEFR